MTKEIPLTQGKVALVDDDDYEELMKYSWHAMWSGHYWYARRGERRDGKQHAIYMHRQILDAASDKDVDHINHNGLDNRRKNLRLCTRGQNSANSKGLGGSSEYRGVHWHKQAGRWRAQITKNNTSHHLGYFEDEKAAAKAYNEAAKDFWGEFAKLNKIKEGA